MKKIMLIVVLVIQASALSFECNMYFDSYKKNSKKMMYELEHKRRTIYANLTVSDIEHILSTCNLKQKTITTLEKSRLILMKSMR